jgi:catalase
MGDRGIPSSWREMNGYSSHTYLWENAGGEKFWVKYHFKTDQGHGYLTQADADRIAGEDGDYFIRDLYNNIKKGNHPSWQLHVQVMPYEDAADYRFNPFDLTKVWPHADYPLIKVGRWVLNRNPENYFAQIEQAAFEPSNLVPGIGTSPDKMLQGRLFAYPDAHRYRIGPNYNQLPVNAPKSEVNSYSKDGAMRIRNASDPVYAPNSYSGPKADPSRTAEALWYTDGEMVRSAYTLRRDDDDFRQANTMVREVLNDEQRARLVSNVSGHLLGGVSEPILLRAFDYWKNIDKEIGDRIEQAVRSAADTPR